MRHHLPRQWTPFSYDLEIERALIRLEMGYAQAPTLYELPAVEDTKRLVRNFKGK